MRGVYFVTSGGKITWEPYEPQPLCDARRGGPRSKITCEMPAGHQGWDGYHYGRGQTGRVYLWKSAEKTVCTGV